MSTQRQQNKSNRRKLPELPCERRKHTFWSSFRESAIIQWMQQHKDSLETAFDISEINPKLMKNQACDTLNELMSKSALSSTMDSVGNCKVATDSTISAPQNNCRIKIPEVPTISVSSDPVNVRTSLKDIPVESIFVCGINVRDKWTTLILDLCQCYFVRCTNVDGDDNNDECLKPITNSDAFIFLMDDQSLSSRKCLKQLNTALKYNVRVIFLREANLKKPSTHDMSKLAEGEHVKHRSGYSNGDLLMDNKSMASNNIHSIHGSQMLYVPRVYDGANSLYLKESNTTILRKENSLSMASYYSEPDVNDVDRLRKNRTINGHVETQRRDRASSTLLMFPSSTSAKTDLPSAVEQGYINALIYDRHWHCDFLVNLKSIFNKKTHVKPNLETKGTFVTTSAPCKDRASSSNDSTVSEMDISFSPEPEPEPETLDRVKDKNSIKDDLDSEHSSQETVYLIFANERGNTPPKIFHWPSDYVNENTPVSNSPSIESFGFEDVDLSKSINNVDIFSSSESD